MLNRPFIRRFVQRLVSGGARQARRRDRTRTTHVQLLERRELLAYDVSPAPFLQWFEASYDTMIHRAPDLFQAGYGAVWTPPPYRGDTSDLTVGYDVYDRFDLGQWDKPTLYGTKEGLQAVAAVLQTTGRDLHVDFVMNHNGYSTLSTPGFYDAGGYPGLAITLPNDIDGDFHSVYWGGPEYERLAGLIDIAQEKNHPFIRSPVDPNDPNNIRAGTTPAFGRIANVPDPENARFYPDIGYNTIFVFDPVTGESDIPIHSFNPGDPLAGDATVENAMGYLMRNAQWLVQTVGVDGLRIDAGKHMQGFAFDFFDRAVYRTHPETLLDGSAKHVFSYTEVFDAEPAVLLPHVKKTIDPNNIGTIGGNRDTLDFKWYFAVKDNLEQYGQGGAWFNVKDAGLDVAHNGSHDGSAGVKFVENHDVFEPWKLDNVANALMLMLPGNAVVYFNGKEFGDNREFPKDGRGDALSRDSLLTRLVEIRETHGKGNYAERWVDNEGVYVFERVSNAVVGLSNRGDWGFDERTVEVGFAPGTLLVELTGNAADPVVDPNNDISEVVTVWQGGDGKSYATIRVPRNFSASGVEHQRGYVIYGLGTPQSQEGLQLLNVDTVMAGDTDIGNSYENGVKRQTDVSVVSADSLQVRLLTNEVRHLGLEELRDIWADGDSALLKLDGGRDINGDGSVDVVTPGDVSYGFEFFTDKSSPLIGAGGIGGPRGDGEFLQTIDLTQVEDGYHFLAARAYRHRIDGGPPTFTEWKESIYVDRLAPLADVFEIKPVNAQGSGDHDVVLASVDGTGDSMHVFLNLPASVSNEEVLAMATSGQGATSQVDIDHFKAFFGGVATGNNVFTVATFESTGTSNVQRLTGQWIDGTGGGMGDLDGSGIVDTTDIDWFAGLYTSNNTLFNPAADFNGDGLIDFVDLDLLGDRLIEVGADQATLDAYAALINNPPQTTNDDYQVDEDAALVVAVSEGVLDNDSDPDGHSLSATLIGDPPAAQDFQLNSDGSFNFTPVQDFNGPATFTYEANDGLGGMTQAVVTIDVIPVNDAPVTTAITVTTLQDAAVDVDLRVLASDVETADDDLVFAVGPAVNGDVGLLPDGYTARFAPAPSYLGPASFDYTVTDDGDGIDNSITSDPATISVQVNLATAPVADLDGPLAGSVVPVGMLNGYGYLDVQFRDTEEGINTDWIDGDELVIAGSGAGTAAIDGSVVDLGGDIYRYEFTGQFGVGVVDITFAAGTFADMAGATNLLEVESFLVIVDPPQAAGGDVSAPAVLQWFEATWATMADRAADVFAAGYGGVWTPPPGRGIYTEEGGGIGYDVYDRFDLGRPEDPTLYGTESGYRTAIETLHQAGALVYADFLINHASSFDATDVDANGVLFAADPNNPNTPHGGGNPGFVMALPFDADGDFHPNPPTEYSPGQPEWEYQFQLAQLYDIDHRKAGGYEFIRQPVVEGDPNNIPSAATAYFLLPEFDPSIFSPAANPTPRQANVPDEYHRRFYPDQSSFFVVNDHVPGDPSTPETGIVIYNFTSDEVTGGVPITENANAYLMRHARWMVQEIGVDGFRVDAARHVYPFVHDFFDRAVFLAEDETLLDGSPRHVFSFLESFTGAKDQLQTFIRKDIDSNDLTTVGGNRDVLDLPLFFAMRDHLTDNGFNNSWHDIVAASQDVYDDGLANNGSQSVAFVSSHDEEGAYLNNVAHAYMLTRPGNAVVYHNARGFNADPTVDERHFPKDGRGDALGGVYGDALTTLLEIRNAYGHGNYLERWIDPNFSNFYAFEREGSMVVGLNSRNGGLDDWDERSIPTSFAEGTLLVELTGNAANATVDSNQGTTEGIPDVITVGAGGQITLRVPQNQNAGGEFHGLGYVVYAPAGPQGTLSLTNVDTVLSGDIPTPQNNPTNRLTDVLVISADEFQIQLDTLAVNLLGDPGLRDHDADGNFAAIRFDAGIDVNGLTGPSGNPLNGVDYVTPGSPLYGFEDFATVNDAGYFANGGAGGAGRFVQSIDATALAEGRHYITVRAFRHTDLGQPPIFTDFRQIVYLDRLAPESRVYDIRPTGAGDSGDHDIIAESLDLTADNMHVLLNLPDAMTDAEVIALANSGQGAADQIDVHLFKSTFSGIHTGNNVITLVTFEPTGNSNVQRFVGQFVNGVGDGLGDVDFDSQYTPADISVFATLLASDDTQFNPAADLDADGRITNTDLILLGDRLDNVGASADTIAAYQSLFHSVIPTDFGDAPDLGAGTAVGDYETLLASGGPSHTIVAGLKLGANVDGDDGTLQNATANADDADGADDENGVLSPLDLLGTEGAAPTVTVLATNTTGSSATLYGWIDYNHDGEFDNTTERGAPVAVPDTSTNGRFTLTFPTIPDNALGDTYARFRLSTDTAAAESRGAANDGEVEDYVISITAPSSQYVAAEQKISDTAGSFDGTLEDFDGFGSSVASLGDLDGDGIADLAVGAMYDADGAEDSGAVWVLLLNADGTVKAEQKVSNTAGGFGGTLAEGDFFGSSLAALGDLDGDGVGDLAVGARRDDDGGNNRGAVWVLLLNADGTVKAEQKISDTTGDFGGTLDDFDTFGNAVAALGDLDGDGVADLAVGARRDDDDGINRGAVWLLMMNADGTVKAEQKISDSSGGFSGTLDDFDGFGSSVAALGDLDGDGVVDLAVGANQDDDAGNDRGAVWVLMLNADGTVKSDKKISDSVGGFAGTLDDDDFFGGSLAALGDLDGDGVADLAVGAYQDDDGGSDRGATWLLLLDTDGTVKSQQKISATSGGFGGMLNDYDGFGGAIAPLGDIDGDGVADLAVGANFDNDGGDARGAVWVLKVAPRSPDSLGMYDQELFYLDTTGNGVWDKVSGGDTFRDFGINPLRATATPVTGDWDGDGDDDLGIYNDGFYYLDTTDNGVWDKVSGGDTFRDFGINPIRATATPIVGDWDGDGDDDLGLYDQELFYLDTTGNGVWDKVSGGDTFRDFGINPLRATATPVTGDWDGDGDDDLGIYNDGLFYLDTTDNGVWDKVSGGDTFRDFGINPIRATATSITGDWDGDGDDDLGVHNQGFFYLDTTQNGVWDKVSGGDTFRDYRINPIRDTGLPLAGRWHFPSPLLAAGGLAATGSPANLTAEDLTPLLDQAIAWWAGSGLTRAEVQRLQSVEVRIADLPGARLGEALSTTITVDVNAAGHGWFVDTTPLDDSEFSVPHSALRVPSSIDLLTVLMHELGHVLGHGDLDAMAADDVMKGWLPIGERRI